MNKNSLKVLFITHSFPEAGSEQQGSSLQLLADALAEQGVQVRVIAPELLGESSEAGDARVERFSAVAAKGRIAGGRPQTRSSTAARKTALNYLGAGFGSAVKVRRDFEPDVVHAHWWFPSGLVGSWLSSLASVPLVTSLHGFDPKAAREGSPARPLFRHVLKRSAAVTVESVAEAGRLSGVLESPAPVIIAPLPLPVDLFSRAAPKRDAAVVLAGPAIGFDVAGFVATLRSLAAEGLDVAVLSDDGNAHLIDPVKVSGVRAIMVDSKDMPALAKVLSRARVAVVHQASDDQRTSVSAAMLAGAPLAFFDGSRSGEMLSQQNQMAIVLDGDSTEERLNGLHSALADESLLRAHAESARMYAVATLAPESCAAKMLGVYLRIVGDVAA